MFEFTWQNFGVLVAAAVCSVFVLTWDIGVFGILLYRKVIKHEKIL